MASELLDNLRVHNEVVTLRDQIRAAKESAHATVCKSPHRRVSFCDEMPAAATSTKPVRDDASQDTRRVESPPTSACVSKSSTAQFNETSSSAKVEEVVGKRRVSPCNPVSASRLFPVENKKESLIIQTFARTAVPSTPTSPGSFLTSQSIFGDSGTGNMMESFISMRQHKQQIGPSQDEEDTTFTSAAADFLRQ